MRKIIRFLRLFLAIVWRRAEKSSTYRISIKDAWRISWQVHFGWICLFPFLMAEAF